jgi:CRP/FNR family cyclic AMP-dependent transcriptional regulator
MNAYGIEMIGYFGTLATVATYSMKNIVPLRIAGIASSFCFIAYSVILGIWPMLLTELIILPINAYRLYESLRDEGRIRPIACPAFVANMRSMRS